MLSSEKETAGYEMDLVPANDSSPIKEKNAMSKKSTPNRIAEVETHLDFRDNITIRLNQRSATWRDLAVELDWTDKRLREVRKHPGRVLMPELARIARFLQVTPADLFSQERDR